MSPTCVPGTLQSLWGMNRSLVFGWGSRGRANQNMQGKLLCRGSEPDNGYRTLGFVRDCFWGSGTGLIQSKRTMAVNGTERPLKRIWEHGFVLSTCVDRETEFASKWEMSVLRADKAGFFFYLFVSLHGLLEVFV